MQSLNLIAHVKQWQLSGKCAILVPHELEASTIVLPVPQFSRHIQQSSLLDTTIIFGEVYTHIQQTLSHNPKPVQVNLLGTG